MHDDAPNCPACLHRLVVDGPPEAPYWWCVQCDIPIAFVRNERGGSDLGVWP